MSGVPAHDSVCKHTSKIRRNCCSRAAPRASKSPSYFLQKLDGPLQRSLACDGNVDDVGALRIVRARFVLSTRVLRQTSLWSSLFLGLDAHAIAAMRVWLDGDEREPLKSDAVARPEVASPRRCHATSKPTRCRSMLHLRAGLSARVFAASQRSPRVGSVASSACPVSRPACRPVAIDRSFRRSTTENTVRTQSCTVGTSPGPRNRNIRVENRARRSGPIRDVG
jgi:hypothetical protein